MSPSVNILVIRPPLLHSEDSNAVIALHSKFSASSFLSSFVPCLLSEMTVQLVVAASAVLYIIIGLPLFMCWLALPLVLGIYCLAYFSRNAQIINNNVKELKEMFLSPTEEIKNGFWLVEEWKSPGEPTEEKSVIQLGNLQEYESLRQQHNNVKRQVIGTLGIRVKEDKDMKEPPRTIGLLDKLYLDPSHRHQGIAQELISKVWSSHCLPNFRAVEALVPANEKSARKFFLNQDWSMVTDLEESYCLGLIRTNFILFRKPCVRGIVGEPEIPT